MITFVDNISAFINESFSVATVEELQTLYMKLYPKVFSMVKVDSNKYGDTILSRMTLDFKAFTKKRMIIGQWLNKDLPRIIKDADERVSLICQTLNCNIDIDVILYYDYANGAGWAVWNEKNQFSIYIGLNSLYSFFGLGRFLSTLLHEVGHIFFWHLRNNYTEYAAKEDEVIYEPVYSMYTEGFAQYFSFLAAKDCWFGGNTNIELYKSHLSTLANQYKGFVLSNTSADKFFYINELSPVYRMSGYYLGYLFVRYLISRFGLQQSLRLDEKQVKDALLTFCDALIA